MDREKRLICSSGELVESKKGIRFVVPDSSGDDAPAFAVRYRGRVYAYINRCAHIQVELDWQHGHFFDSDGEYLMCATHGALYDPETGHCIAGPCKDAKLSSLDVKEEGDEIFILV